MIMLHHALGAVALALSLPLSVAAQAPQGCIGDDGFNIGWCEPVVNMNLPPIPRMSVDGDFCCLLNCDLEQSFSVKTSINHLPIGCDLALIQVQVAPGAPGAPGYIGSLLGKYSRTWVETTTLPSGQTLERQVWRWLVNGPMVSFAGAAPCPIPPHADPSVADDVSVHFTGHIDYACDINPLVPNRVDKFLINLNHEVGCISHNTFSAKPYALPIAHHDRSYHLFGPAGFVCQPVQEPTGSAPGEAVRSTRLPGNYVCLGEAPIIDGAIDTLAENCLCMAGVTGPLDYKHQVFRGVTDCNGVTNQYLSFFLNAPPVLPFPAGMTAHPLGLWVNPPDTFPGLRELTTYFGFLQYVDECNPNDFPVKVTTGVGTLRPEGGLVYGGTDPGALFRSFIDLEDMLLPTGIFGPYTMGWGTLFISKVVWNINIK